MWRRASLDTRWNPLRSSGSSSSGRAVSKSCDVRGWDLRRVVGAEFEGEGEGEGGIDVLLRSHRLELVLVLVLVWVIW